MTDPYCKTMLDDEGSFHSGIPGDDSGFPSSLDCWFDGDSGSGDDDCSIHACCDLSGPCPADLDPGSFDPGQCGQSQACPSTCAPMTKAGCDCFGCCEVCTPGNGCIEVFVNPLVSPACTLDALGDPSMCRRCVRNAQCRGADERIFANGFENVAGPTAANDAANAELAKLVATLTGTSSR